MEGRLVNRGKMGDRLVIIEDMEGRLDICRNIEGGEVVTSSEDNEPLYTIHLRKGKGKKKEKMIDKLI
jgi:hypothetical protein